MNCTKCGKEIDKNEVRCPYCNELITSEDSFELPTLKEKQNDEIIELESVDYNLSDNDYGIELPDDIEQDSENFDHFDVDNLIDENQLLGETKKISLEKETSLIDDIQEKIDDMGSNEESSNNSTDNNEDNLINDESFEINTKASVKKRRKIFIISVLCMVILISVGVTLLQIYNKMDKRNTNIVENNNEDVQKKVEQLLNEYYENNDRTAINNYLESIKNDQEKLSIAIETTERISRSWVTTYYEDEINSKEELEKSSTKIKTSIDNIHIYCVVTTDSLKNVKLISDELYEELLKEISVIYDDSDLYFEALDLYNAKNYNQAYPALENIPNDNRYYSKASNMKINITNEIITLLKNDISKITDNIDSLSEKEKLACYIAIEDIIYRYESSVYYGVPLSDVNEYNSLLQEYRDLVELYSSTN